MLKNPYILFHLNKKFNLKDKKIKCINENVLLFDKKIIKAESQIFKILIDDIKKIYKIYNNKFLPNYKFLCKENIYYYDLTSGDLLSHHKCNFLNKRKLYNNIIEFIKKTKSIKTKNFNKISKNQTEIKSDNISFIFLEKQYIQQFSKKNIKLYNDIIILYNSIKGKKLKSHKKMLFYIDFNYHNFIIDEKYNITRIDLSEGLSFYDYLQVIPYYIALLWKTNDINLVKKGIIECNLKREKDIILKMSFILYCLYMFRSFKKSPKDLKFNRNIFKTIKSLS
tara:strand:- start:77 stop:919 length:843 start_codon:yes stop_codon:yes gene_type:complete